MYTCWLSLSFQLILYRGIATRTMVGLAYENLIPGIKYNLPDSMAILVAK